ncbi:MAG TPA: SLC13 family permease [Anaeromyxobacteraceae bacterium]|nr:SLC13 family permease [Anaeromyxobacteraceae bacterium]
MNVPVISLVALLIAIVISCVTPLNVGTLSVGLALVIGLIGGVKMGDIVKGYPASLFLLLAGTTYLFAIAQTNGTLEKVAKYAVKAVRGRAALLPVVLFLLAFGLSALGPGQITISALLAPASMLLAAEVGISPLLMALVVGNGAQAGAMSPLAPPGIISANLLAKQGLTGVGGVLWLNMLIVHVAVSVFAYFLFGGLRLWREATPAQSETLRNIKVEPFDRAQLATIAGVLALVICAVFFKLDIGFTAFLIGALLSLGKAVDEGKAIKAMPWNTILMVTGVTVLVSLMGTVGGMDLFAKLIAKMSTPGTVTLVAGFWAGLVSAYASTTGVILPAFLPMAGPLIKELGGGELLPLVSSIIVCGFVVDLSPLSTTGAVFIANAAPSADKNKLFRDMLIWGLSMSVVGALASWIAFTVLGLP